MQTLAQQLTKVEAEIAQTIAQLPAQLRVAELYEPIRYILDLGGKRLRPALVLMAAQLYTHDTQAALLPAIGFEVFHNFTLLHDDIMDKAPIRRGKPTVHTKWTENIAILAGDAMMIKAYDYLSLLPAEEFKAVFQVFNKVALEVCIGQQMDMNFEQKNDVSFADYTEMISLKTSVLIAGALKVGAIIGGAPASDIENLYQFGLNLGLSFQVQDDLLDVYGDQNKFGKTTGGDIVANKKTFLLIEALQKAQGETKTKLHYWLEKTEFDAAEKVAQITAIYNELGIREATQTIRDNYFAQAIASLDKIEGNRFGTETIREFAHWLLNREK